MKSPERRYYSGYVDTVNRYTHCHDVERLKDALRELYGIPEDAETEYQLKQALYEQLEREWRIPHDAYRHYPDAEIFLQ